MSIEVIVIIFFVGLVLGLVVGVVIPALLTTTSLSSSV